MKLNVRFLSPASPARHYHVEVGQGIDGWDASRDAYFRLAGICEPKHVAVVGCAFAMVSAMEDAHAALDGGDAESAKALLAEMLHGVGMCVADAEIDARLCLAVTGAGKAVAG